jgi:hypothetical protein
MSNAATVEARLRSTLNAWSLPIEPNCQALLVAAIHEAALRVEREGFAADPQKLWEAENNLRKLLTQMTLEAGALHLHALHEPTFVNARQTLCPLWPFC